MSTFQAKIKAVIDQESWDNHTSFETMAAVLPAGKRPSWSSAPPPRGGGDERRDVGVTHNVLRSDGMAYQFIEPVPDAAEDTCEPVGVLEIADRLGVQDRSVHMMIRRDRLPAADFDSINGSRAWNWRTILWWAGETGRLRTRKLVNEYRRTFDLEPPIVVNGKHPNGVIERPDPRPTKPKVPAKSR